MTAWNVAGLAMFAVGIGFALVAVGTLKRFYAPTLLTRPDHRLVTHGVYRIVRHPIYLGVLVAILGVPVYALLLGRVVRVLYFAWRHKSDAATGLYMCCARVLGGSDDGAARPRASGPLLLAAGKSHSEGRSMRASRGPALLRSDSSDGTATLSSRGGGGSSRDLARPLLR